MSLCPSLALSPRRSTVHSRGPPAHSVRGSGEMTLKCTHVYTHTHTHTGTHSSVHKYTHTYPHTHTQAHTQVYTCTHTHIHTHTGTHSSVHMYTHIYTHTQAHTQVYTCTHTHIHTHTGTPRESKAGLFIPLTSRSLRTQFFFTTLFAFLMKIFLKEKSRCILFLSLLFQKSSSLLTLIQGSFRNEQSSLGISCQQVLEAHI